MVVLVVMVCLFLMILWLFKVFDVNLLLINGGLFKLIEMLVFNIYIEVFVNNRYGLGEVKVLIFFIVVVVIIII